MGAEASTCSACSPLSTNDDETKESDMEQMLKDDSNSNPPQKKDNALEKQQKERRDYETTFSFYNAQRESKKSKQDYIAELANIFKGSALKAGDVKLDEDHFLDKGYQAQGVYKVLHQKQKKHIALKKLGIFEDWHVPSYQLRVIGNEYRVFQTLQNQHKNIVQFYGGFVPESTPSVCYLGLELLGSKMYAFLQADYKQWNTQSPKEFPPVQWIEALGHLADGVAFMHRHGFVHRDLHKWNVLCRESESNAFPEFVLVDFGLALNVNDEDYDGKFQRGSRRHYSPESCDSFVYSTKSDVFGFGSMLFEVTTGGEIIFGDGVNEGEAFRLLQDGNMPEMEATVNEEYKKVVQRCWVKDPEQRATMDEVSKSLLQIAAANKK